MIEPTDEMKAAFRAAQERRAEELVAEGAPLGGHDILDRGLAAVLTLVERDHCMEPKGHVFHPLRKEHRPKGDIWWNRSAEAYEAECVCGETFSGWPHSDAEERLLTHLAREARP